MSYKEIEEYLTQHIEKIKNNPGVTKKPNERHWVENKARAVKKIKEEKLSHLDLMKFRQDADVRNNSDFSDLIKFVSRENLIFDKLPEKLSESVKTSEEASTDKVEVCWYFW